MDSLLADKGRPVELTIAMPEQPETFEASSATPTEAREFIRHKNHTLQPTSGFCQGYVQANLAIVPAEQADNFERMCKLNSGPLPLLYRSEVGEKTAGFLSSTSNVKTDLPGYRIVRTRLMDEIVSDISNVDLSKYVSFYLGCSFSFEKVLMDHGIHVRNVDEGDNVSMFRSTIPLIPSGPFHGKLVVSMRPFPKHQLSAVCSLSHPLTSVHGCPIHIGNFRKIGIISLDKPHYGDPVEVREGEVPVFWCCGVTAAEVLNTAQLPFCITHLEGSMFITDQKVDPGVEVPPDFVHVQCIDPLTQYYGICQKSVYEKLCKMEKIVAADPGNRGIEPLRISDDFVSACFALSQADNILLTTGFACHTGDPVPYENDGPTGTLSLARMLLDLGKRVTIYGEDLLIELMREMAKSFIPVDAYTDLLRFVTVPECYRLTKPFDAYVAIERTAPGADGNHYTMKARRLPKDRFTQPAERVFLKARSITIGVGDGGNELGMGKVSLAVRDAVPNGSVICSSIGTDLLIAAGVSNWGAWGLAFGLRALSWCEIHDRYKRRGLGSSKCPSKSAYVPSVRCERQLLDHCERLGMIDGIRKEPGHVDGMPWEGEHVKTLEALRAVLVE